MSPEPQAQDRQQFKWRLLSALLWGLVPFLVLSLLGLWRLGAAIGLGAMLGQLTPPLSRLFRR